jgi:hypothetical protein
LLVPAIGAAPLPQPRTFTAGPAAVAVPAITVRADQEYCATLPSRTKPLPQNDFAVFRRAPLEAAVDNRSGFVAPLNHVLFVAAKVANLEPRRANGEVPSTSTTQYNLRMFPLIIGLMIRACGTDDVAWSANVQISTFSDD